MIFLYFFVFCIFFFTLSPNLLAQDHFSKVDCNRSLLSIADYYKNFNELSEQELPHKDYRITKSNKNSVVVILTPHGGFIEFLTSEIVKGIAGSEYSYYLFEGIKPSGNWKLHITSQNFDEPQALALVSRAQVALSVHGYKNEINEIIEIGGRNLSLGEKISEALVRQGFKVAFVSEKFPAYEAANIVNKAQFGGVQVEVPSILRDQLKDNPVAFNLFIRSIREGIDLYKALRNHTL